MLLAWLSFSLQYYILYIPQTAGAIYTYWTNLHHWDVTLFRGKKRNDLFFRLTTPRLSLFSQNMEVLNSMEGAPMRIIKAQFLPPPAPPPSVSAARPVQGPLSGSSTSPPTTSSSEPRTDPPRMATIEEDSGGDSPPGTAFPPSSTAAKSFEDLTEHSPLNRQNRRLQRQARIESKETEC